MVRTLPVAFSSTCAGSEQLGIVAVSVSATGWGGAACGSSAFSAAATGSLLLPIELPTSGLKLRFGAAMSRLVESVLVVGLAGFGKT